jgi:hypothetical protein
MQQNYTAAERVTQGSPGPNHQHTVSDHTQRNQCAGTLRPQYASVHKRRASQTGQKQNLLVADSPQVASIVLFAHNPDHLLKDTGSNRCLPNTRHKHVPLVPYSQQLARSAQNSVV